MHSSEAVAQICFQNRRRGSTTLSKGSLEVRLKTHLLLVSAKQVVCDTVAYREVRGKKNTVISLRATVKLKERSEKTNIGIQSEAVMFKGLWNKLKA